MLKNQCDTVIITEFDRRPMVFYLPIWAIKTYFFNYFALAMHNWRNVSFGQYGLFVKLLFVNLIYAYRTIGIEYRLTYKQAYEAWFKL
jgi:hypothetical protein